MSHDSVARTIGERVRAARAAAAMSRRQLSERANVSERYLNELENGDANVSVGILGRVADALGVDLVSLLASPVDAMPDGRSGKAMHGGLASLIGGMSLREQESAIPFLERFIEDRRKSLKGVALLGLRGAGKSTIGGLFAARHGLPFLSVTREIETRAGMALSDLFNLAGPEGYRSLENEVVAELAERNDRIVLETAGGIVSNGSALDIILGSFKTVWLKARPEEHLSRVIEQGDMRPMRGKPRALEHLQALLARREQEYARADCVLDTTGRTPDACVDELELIAGGAVAHK
jgi:XRE family aerobic/anaerobic benzoate catabolism transcriptional regulator